ncbi:FAD synthase-like protein, partial [Tanacetum coccineum]
SNADIGQVRPVVIACILSCSNLVPILFKQRMRGPVFFIDNREKSIESTSQIGGESVEPEFVEEMVYHDVAKDVMLLVIVGINDNPILLLFADVVSPFATVRSEIDSEEVERRKSMSDLVFMYGGVGPLHSDVTVGGVDKAFGVRLEHWGSKGLKSSNDAPGKPNSIGPLFWKDAYTLSDVREETASENNATLINNSDDNSDEIV